MSGDFYSVLGVSHSASAEEIKKSYKKLAVKYHPDKTQEKAHHERFLAISKAYDTLRDEQLRRAYDTKMGYSMKPQASFASGSGPFGWSRPDDNVRAPFSHDEFYHQRSKNAYFSFFHRNERAYADAHERDSFDDHEAKQREAEVAARLAQKKMQEDMERRRNEYMREAQRQRHEEERRQREEELRRNMEEALLAQKRNRSTHNSFAYEEAKHEAYRNVWQRPSSPVRDGSQPGHNSAEPIVVEDDDEGDSGPIGEDTNDSDSPVTDTPPSEEGRGHTEEGNTDEFEDCFTVPPSENPADSSFAENEARDPYASTDPQASPEVVEVPEDSEEPQPTQQSTPKVKPEPRFFETSPERFPSRKAYGNKRARLSNFDSLKTSLGPDLDQLDFSDIRSTLPETKQKARKASASTAPQSPKRPRVAEYTDGTSKAQTLFTPINKTFTKSRQNTISTSDLAPAMDDSQLMFSSTPPIIKVSKATTKDDWDSYVKGIHEYERKFAAYRKAVVQYQMGRLEKDERHHNIIYSDTSCLDVYQQSLFNDILLLQNYSRALQDFRKALKIFNLNCETVNSMEHGI